MARVCQVTGKKPITGNKVSHSNIKTKRRFLPNLQTKRYFLAEEDKWVTLKLSSEAIRTINKNGMYEVEKEMREGGAKIKSHLFLKKRNKKNIKQWQRKVTGFR